MTNKAVVSNTGIILKLNETSTLISDKRNNNIVKSLEKSAPLPRPIINDKSPIIATSITYILPIFTLSSPIKVKIPISFLRCDKKTFVAYQIKKKTKIIKTIEIT